MERALIGRHTAALEVVTERLQAMKLEAGRSQGTAARFDTWQSSATEVVGRALRDIWLAGGLKKHPTMQAQVSEAKNTSGIAQRAWMVFNAESAKPLTYDWDG